MLMFALRFLGASSDGIWRQRYQWWHVHGWEVYSWNVIIKWFDAIFFEKDEVSHLVIICTVWGCFLCYFVCGVNSDSIWRERYPWWDGWEGDSLLQRIYGVGWNEAYKKEGKENLALLCRGYCLQLCICMSISRQIQFGSQDIWFKGWQKNNSIKWIEMMCDDRKDNKNGSGIVPRAHWPWLAPLFMLG